jgi:site-specific DNA recombinase
MQLNQKIALIYARYSSDNQRAESITAQIRACKDYARKKDYLVKTIYTDEAKSGVNDNRSGFQEMISYIRDNPSQVQVILVHKLDRFARNRYDSAIYRKELEKAGVRLESVLENFDDLLKPI